MLLLSAMKQVIAGERVLMELDAQTAARINGPRPWTASALRMTGNATGATSMNGGAAEQPGGADVPPAHAQAAEGFVNDD